MKHSEHTQLTDRKLTFIFINLVVSGIASATLSTAMTTALPVLVNDFEVSNSVGQWVTSGYSLAMGMVMPLTAFLITRFPTKKLYMTGVSSFIAGLLLSIFAGNFGLMMVGRVLQACGNGILMSAAQVIILTAYPDEKKGTMMGTYGLVSTQAGLPLLIGIVVCTLFVIRQWGLEKPFLDVTILGNRDYAVSVISSMVLYLVMMGSSVIMPLYVQSVMGYSAVISGLVTLPGSFATAIVSPFAGRLYDKMGIKTIFIAGSAALVVSNLGMCCLTMTTPLWVAAGLNVIRNLSIGSLMMPLLTWDTSNVSSKKAADASSQLTSFGDLRNPRPRGHRGKGLQLPLGAVLQPAQAHPPHPQSLRLQGPRGPGHAGLPGLHRGAGHHPPADAGG